MKHQFFTRSLFVAFCAFFVCTSAVAETTAEAATVHLNPFAFKLSSSLNGDVFTVTYYLNAPATDVKVSIDINNDGKIDGNDVVYNCNAVENTKGTTLVKGIYTANISLREKINDVAAFRNKTNLRWYVDVKGGNQSENDYTLQSMTYYTQGPNKGSFTGKTSVTHEVKVLNAQKVSREYLFNVPSSIDIDVNPQSDNFGMIYCTESRMLTDGSDGSYTLKSEAERLNRFTYWGTAGDVKGGTGLYVFDAAFQNMPPLETNYDFVTPKTDNDRTIARGYDMGVSRQLTDQIQLPFHTKYRNASGSFVERYVRPLGPRKLRLSEDGSRLFVSFFTTDGTCLREGDVSRLSYNTNSNSWITRVISQESDNLVLDGTDTESYISSDYGTEFHKSYAIETNSGAFAAGPNIAFDTYGKDNGLKLLMLSGTRYSIEPYLRESFRCDEYNLGTLKVWNTVSSTYTNNSGRDIFTRDMNGKTSTGTDRGLYQNAMYVDGENGSGGVVVLAVSYERSNLEYDQNGGFWYSVSRLNATDMASLVHFDANKNITFTEYWAGRDRAGIRYNHTYDKLLVAGGPYNISWHSTVSGAKRTVATGTNSDGKTVYGHPQAMPGWATIYTVNKKDINTKKVNDSQTAGWRDFMYSNSTHRQSMFTDSVYLKLEDGLDPEDFAWDYADNIYIASGFSSGKVVAYALPHKNKVVSTPCKDDNKIEDTYASQLTVNIYPQNVNCGTVVDYEFQKSFAWYMNGAKYKLEAKPADGYRFVSWYDTDSQHEPVFAQHHTKEDKTETVQADFGINVHEDTKIVDINSDTDFKAVYVKRDLDAESYSTICLPFNLETLVGTPYEGASVLEFTAEEKSNVDGDNRISLNFTEVEFGAGKGMRAGVPYLIQVKNAVSGEKMFWDVTCPDIDNQGQSVININGAVTFHALLNPTTFTAAQLRDMLFLTADNRLVTLYGQNSVSINGLRGYFTVRGGMSKNAEFVLNLPDKVVTSTPFVGIEETQQPTKYMQNGQLYIQQGEQVYNMNGALVK